MANAPDVRELVDAFLVAKKTLAGEAQWQPDIVPDVYRWLASVQVNGEISGFTLTVKAYPRADDLTFRLILALDKAVWRLDFAYDEPHTNSLNAPADIRGLIVTDHHFHSWDDNRRFATARTLPGRLHNARLLAPNIQTFDNAFRWFCGATNIEGIDNFGIPCLPKPTGLI